MRLQQQHVLPSSTGVVTRRPDAARSVSADGALLYVARLAEDRLDPMQSPPHSLTARSLGASAAGGAQRASENCHC